MSAADLDVRAWPDVSFPVTLAGTPGGVDGFDASLFSVGGGARIAGDVELFNLLAPSIELGIHAQPALNAGVLYLADGGVGLGVYAYPVPRLKARAAVGAGAYLATYGALQAVDWYWKLRAEVGYRFSPAFTLSAGAEYAQYRSGAGVLYSGLSIGITADVSLSFFGTRTSGIAASGAQEAPVFPVFYTSYASKPVGTVSLTNNEQAEIRDVRVSFKVPGYTSGGRACAAFPVIARGQTVSAPLYADFTDQVLALSESTKVQGEVLVDYSLLDTRLQAKKAQTIQFNHRNLTTWADDTMLGAFASPNDPAVLEFSKYAAGLVRDLLRTGIDRKLQYAVALFEGLRLSGVSWAADPSTPYAAFHRDASRTDYLQYPAQTLTYRGGDSDDLAVLVAAVLASVSVEAAFVPLDDDVLVAVALETPEADARAAFSDPSSLVYRDGTAWLPLRMSLIREGFLSAWMGGATLYARAAAAGAPPRFFTLSAAWEAHAAVAVPALEGRAAKPAAEQLALSFENTMGRFVAREIGARVDRMKADIARDGTDRQHNALGMLYSRYGLLAEGKAAFRVAADRGYLPSLTNLGNIALLEKDFEQAAAIFGKVLAAQPANKAAILGLARARYELDQFSESDELFSLLQEMDPALADSYSYLSSRVPGSASRAAAAGDQGKTLWDDED